MGRSRGGLTTKSHALVDAEGRPVRLALTPGRAGDAPTARGLIGDLGKASILIAAEAHDADAIRAHAASGGGWANVPPRVIRKRTLAFSRFIYCQRNLVGRFFSRIGHFRGLAPRYDRRPDNFLTALKLGAVRVWSSGK